MTGKRLSELVRFFHRISDGEGAAWPDGELLERYLGQGDEAAFELLVWRHGMMVLNVCRRILHHEQDAEDAFQATFLMLVRKGGSIRRQGALAGWLYRVAFRIALEARERARKRAGREVPVLEPLAAPLSRNGGWEDIRPILDEEVNHLPERLRLPFVLCYLEGKTNHEAARLLGCSPGTIFSRLARGRERLRRRLVRRGLGVSAVGLGTLVGEHAVVAAPAPVLIQAATQTAILYASGQAGGVSAQISTLTEGVLKAMFVKKIKLAGVLVLMLGFLAVGGAITHRALLAASQTAAKNEDPPPEPKVPPRQKAPEVGVLVSVARPVSQVLDRLTVQPGSVEAFEWVELVNQIPGTLKNLRVDIGSVVKKDELLAEIDAPLLVIEVGQAKLNLDIAKGNFHEAEAKVITAGAELTAARKQIDLHKKQIESAKAFLEFRKQEYKRFKELVVAKAIDQRLLEEELNKLKAAESQLTAAEIGLEKAQADIIVKQAHVDQSKASLKTGRAQVSLAEFNVEKARTNLDFTKLRAPFDGVVVKRDFANGAFLQGNRPLLTVSRVDKMKVVVQVPERDVPHLEIGAPAEISLPSLALKLIGKVARFAHSVDKTTRSMRAEIDLVNEKGFLRDGMYGEVTIQMGKGTVPSLTLPSRCLIDTKVLPSSKKGLAFVYVIRNGVARLTEIQVGQRTGERLEVISGLGAADQVVTDPERLLPAGEKEAPKTVPVKIR